MRNVRQTLIVAIVAALLALLALLAFHGCSGENVDLADGIHPVNSDFAPTIERVTEDLLALETEVERQAYLNRNFPNLATGITGYLRDDQRITDQQEVSRVEILLGSAEGVQAEEGGNAELRNGHFRDRLFAKIWITGETEPRQVILICMNGLTARPEDFTALQSLATVTPRERFTIGRGESLITYLPFRPAIAVAERFNLPLYEGRVQRPEHRITPERAYELEWSTNDIQVTVGVVAGDQFDMIAGTFTPSPLRRSRG